MAGRFLIHRFRTHVPLLVLGLGLLGPVGCDDPVTVSSPAIAVEATTVDFGPVAVGEAMERAVTVRSTSPVAAPLQVELTGPDREQFEVTAPERVTFRDEVQVRFQPFEPRPHEARLVLRACGGCEAHEVALTGTGRWSLLEAWPPALDFGFVGIGDTEPRTLRLVNRATDDLVVGAVEVEPVGTGPEEAEAFVADESVLPLTVPAGEERTLTLGFTPTRRAEFEALLVWRAPTTARKMGEVPLVGWGRPEPELAVPDRLSFGEQTVGLPAARTLTLSNTGEEDLRIEEATLRGEAAFALEADLPWTLVPGGSLDLAVVWTPQALGPESADIVLRTSDPDAKEAVVALEGTGVGPLPCTLELSQEQLDFGATVQGLEYRRMLVITNLGETGCEFQQLVLQGDTDPAFTLREGGAVAPFVLSAGEARTVMVAFRAPGGPAEGAVSLFTAHPSSRTLVPLSAGDGDLTPLPPHVDFGVVDAACGTSRRELCLYDFSDHGDRVSSVSLSFADGPGTFGWVGFESGAEVPAHGRLCGWITFTGPSGSRTRAEIRMGFDTGRTVTVTAEGRIEVVPMQTERFEQVADRRIDVLFLVERQWDVFVENLATGAADFLQAAETADRDWRVAATPTHCASLSSCGSLTAHPTSGRQVVTPFLEHPDAELADILRATQSDFVAGPADLRGLWTAFEAVGSADPRALPLLRPGAELALVFQSLQDDQSPETVDFYLNWLKALGGDTLRVRVHAIAGDPAAPTDGAGFATCPAGVRFRPPTRYTTAVRSLGGAFEDICHFETPGAGAFLGPLGDEVFGYRRKFPLEGLPDPTSIEVTLEAADGSVLDLAGRWSYDDEYNVVVLAVGWAPEPGDTLVVRYRPRCR